jgi:hypothetical protein
MRPRKYNQTLLNKVKKLRLSGLTGVEISKQLKVPTSAISLFKKADYCFETYLKNQRENTEFYTNNKQY